MGRSRRSGHGASLCSAPPGWRRAAIAHCDHQRHDVQLCRSTESRDYREPRLFPRGLGWQGAIIESSVRHHRYRRDRFGEGQKRFRRPHPAGQGLDRLHVQQLQGSRECQRDGAVAPLRPSHHRPTPPPRRLPLDAARAMLIRILRRIAGGPFVEVGRLEGGIPAFIDNLPPGALGGGVAYSIEASNGKGLVEKASVTIDPAKAATESTGTPTATNPEARITSEG